jgi:hypothetical protein
MTVGVGYQHDALSIRMRAAGMRQTVARQQAPFPDGSGSHRQPFASGTVALWLISRLCLPPQHRRERSVVVVCWFRDSGFIPVRSPRKAPERRLCSFSFAVNTGTF